MNMITCKNTIEPITAHNLIRSLAASGEGYFQKLGNINNNSRNRYQCNRCVVTVSVVSSSGIACAGYHQAISTDQPELIFSLTNFCE